MEILLIGLVAAIALIVLPRFLGRRREKILAQFEVLEKRFGFERKVTPSRWGKGIAEHHSLRGKYRGYTVSLYEHFHGKGKERITWTSLVMEVLFAEEFELRIEFASTGAAARFSPITQERVTLNEGGIRVGMNQESASSFVLAAGARGRLGALAAKPGVGAIRLSKGFLEYREAGEMVDDADRVRYQEALMLLADLADGVSVYASKKKG